MVRRMTLLFFVCFFASTVYTQTQELPRVGVLDLTSENVPAAELRLLSDRLRIELFNTGQFLVLERQRMEEILKEQGFQQSGCVETECVVEVGQLLGTQKMVAGSVGRVGEVYTISLRSINVETGVLERTAVKDCRCSLEEVLTRSIAQVAAELAGTAVVTTPLPRSEGVGMLYISSTPLGAQIVLDGRPQREVTPATLTQLPAGEHIIRLVKENLIAEERVTVVRDDLVKVSPTLRPGLGSLFINSSPPEAQVAIDGKACDPTPVLIREIAPGPHTVRVTKADYLPWEDQVVVELGKQTTVPIVLQPCGYLSIQIMPLLLPNAVVEVDGREARRGGFFRSLIAPGEHRVVVRLAGHDSLVQTVAIAQGQAKAVRVTMTGGQIQAEIRTDPTRWSSGPFMPTARGYLAAAEAGGRLYVVGGFGGSRALNTLEIFDPSTNQWTTGPSMPTARSSLAAAAIGGKLYVVGGLDSNRRLNILESYDPSTNRWTTGPSMPTARSSLAAAGAGGKLYVVGGFDGSRYLNTLEIFDPATGGWTTGSPMPTALGGLAATEMNGRLYVVGGWDGSYKNELEIYDPVMGGWTAGPSMPTARSSLAATEMNGRLYVIGGQNGPSILEILGY